MKHLITCLTLLGLISQFSCSKSSGGEIVPPHIATRNVMKATLTFSSDGHIFEMNATGDSTLFVYRNDTANKQEIVTINGSAGDFNSLEVILFNISTPGTYAFRSNPADMGNAYAICYYKKNLWEDLFTTYRVDAPGAVTLEKITTDSVIGYFNAKVTNFYPGKTEPASYITVTNGYFKGRIERPK